MTGRPILGELYIVTKQVDNTYYRKGDILRLAADDGSSCPWFMNKSRDTNQGSRIAVDLPDIELYETKEESTMTNETQERPAFIIITRNTEVFKKGGVFKRYESFYSPVDVNTAFVVAPYGDKYIKPEQADVLLDKKVAVAAVEFNPAYVTLEQNDVLQNALMSMNNKKVKKVTKKSGK